MKNITQIFFRNTVRFLIYFSGMFALISFLFNKKITGEIKNFFEVDAALPDTFKVILCCSFLFLIFTVVVSAVAAARQQNHFRTSIVLRLIIFVMNIIPIALFQHVLFQKFGFRILYFVIIYLIIQLMLDKFFRSLIAKIKLNSSLSVFLSKFIPELLVVVVSLFLVNILPNRYHRFDMSIINMDNIFQLSSFFLYIVFFNSVTFFTVEYCINAFRDEFKKNYVKYYFIVNENYFRRTLFVLKNAMPLVLEKIRKNLSWLVMFTIAVDSIIGNTGSIGSNLLDAFSPESGFRGDYGASTVIRNVFYILIIMYVINTVIDIAIKLLKKNREDEKEQEPDEKESSVQRKISRGKGRIVYRAAFLVFLVIYAGLFLFNQREYALAGYYDFKWNTERTVNDFLKEKRIGPDRYPADIMAEYIDTYLCEKKENPSCYSIVMIDVQDTTGKISHLIPCFDYVPTGGRYFFIENNANTYPVDISPLDNIVSIYRIEKYKNRPFTNIMTSFRLPADTDANKFYEKPLYLVIPFYLFHFLTLLLVVVIFTVLLYNCIVKFHFAGKSAKKYFIIPGKISREILLFLNSITLIVVFLLVNYFIEKNMQTVWINKTFVSSFLSYTLVQLIIIAMFSDSYINEIALYVKGALKTKEFEYYGLIGLNSKNQNYIFNKKYGTNLLLKLIFQNILFVYNINWFISYAFNLWKLKFIDYIGITYSISFENTLTKIISFNSLGTSGFNFMLLIIFNAILFIGYFHFDNKLSKR